MRCSDVMTKDPVCCTPDDTVTQVAKMMKTEDVGSIPVCESRTSKMLAGIVTDRDLVINVLAEGRDTTKTKVDAVMTRNPFVCRPNDDLDDLCETMEQKQVRRVPVVDDKGQLVGIVAQADLATRSGQPEKTAEVVEEISRPSMAHA
jgi:CBS domain-containing protein